MNQSHIRNFCIIAHIDHGKSTLADRLMEMTGTVEKRDMQAQLLDSNPIERERGITIKLAPVRMEYRSSSQPLNTNPYILNLIDTPGHVDFSYEVSRSLAACEGAILLVDATQGVQAQTLSNLTKAREQKLTIIPVINKIDMPNARIKESIESLESLGFRKEEVLEISAKTGQGVSELLEAVIDRIPSPKGVSDGTPRALVFSSVYDDHKGVIVFVRVVDGSIQVSESSGLRFMASGAEIAPIQVGYFLPALTSRPGLEAGEVGYIATGLKDAKLAKVGDTITVSHVIARSEATRQSPTKTEIASPRQLMGARNDNIIPLPGYKDPKPMVFLGLYPINSDDLSIAREAMERLRLSDAAFTFKPIHSAALGNGFHCGFLGLLHAEIVQERLLREFNLSMIATSPSVEYEIRLKTQDVRQKIQSASEFPDPSVIEETREPVMQVTIFTPSRFVGPVMQLAQEKRGSLADHMYRADQAELTYLIPLSDLIIDFFDRLKSITEGYASLDYEFYDYQTVNVVKVDILVNKEKVDALSFLVVTDQAQRRSKEIVDRLAAAIPRQQFEAPVQAAIGGSIIARADIKAFRKDVIAKLYGGDRSRKDKLLDKQKRGKAKMKRIGSVDIPQDAFFAVLKRS